MSAPERWTYVSVRRSRVNKHNFILTLYSLNFEGTSRSPRVEYPRNHSSCYFWKNSRDSTLLYTDSVISIAMSTLIFILFNFCAFLTICHSFHYEDVAFAEDQYESSHGEIIFSAMVRSKLSSDQDRSQSLLGAKNCKLLCGSCVHSPSCFPCNAILVHSYSATVIA